MNNDGRLSSLRGGEETIGGNAEANPYPPAIKSKEPWIPESQQIKELLRKSLLYMGLVDSRTTDTRNGERIMKEI